MEAKFAAMLEEWSLLRRDASRGEVERWERKFDELREEEWRLRDEGKWLHGRSDFLGVLRRQRDELAHPRMIAWLLDPCAYHGLGTRVLRGVVEKVFGPESGSRFERARTMCEVPLVDGRLDIVVEGAGFYLVIENKVDALEAEEQCAYYSRHLPTEARCILLSPDGRTAGGATTFKSLRYTELASILREALAASPDGAGRRVAECYLDTLDREFPDDR